MSQAPPDFQQQLMEAARLHERGDRDGAISHYRQLRVRQPFHPPLLNLLGLALVQSGRPAEGLPLLEDAVRRAPALLDGWINLGYARREAGQAREAADCYRRALRLQPRHRVAAMSLASILVDSHDAEAEPLLRRLMAETPDAMLPLLKLHRLLRRRGDEAGLQELEQKAATLALRSPEELIEAGLLRGDQLRFAEARDLFAAVLQQRPDHPFAALAFADALHLNAEFAAAVDGYRRAADLAPSAAAPWIGLGQAYMGLKQMADAATAFEEALRRDPENARARHLLDAAKGRSGAAVPAAYVRQEFDDFAATFELNLVQKLGYRSPTLIAERLVALFPGRSFATVLDIGCGTGLAARALEAITVRRVGLDLSSRMLKQAERCGLYAELVEAEATSFLQRSQATFELAIAADVLTYLGDLAPLLGALHGRLADGGIFAATTEHARPGEPDYLLRGTGRYAHSESYLRTAAASAGFDWLHFEVQPLRREREGMIEGGYMYLRRR